MTRTQMRSALGKAVGLGSARDGVENWLLERVSAVALIPLTLWFTVSTVMHAGDDYATVMAWLRRPVTTTLMALLLMALFHHTALGLQVIIEDYVHSRMKVLLLVGMRLGCLAMAVTGLVATLKIAFGA
ncbi:succinate dehydrogenase, hydrophobic membrane anchor protein [Bradyrhizobium sp.]|uniref:succinate dehydrogenase, hydrophobic membrane anchor protein n=1 Tax=Bradyrhizobium sp. TaxID=376 RepID=UPI002388ED72|nr:succinate dehydrogenase, hydrophobic membrane anchor protein [Bradyrhizobium sp.]MDE2379943.1 succinate dehydrogenase, hydrophobic membrane anchor protein [Bradyrhizobium sp.]